MGITISTDAAPTTTTATMIYAKSVSMKNQKNIGSPDTEHSLSMNQLLFNGADEGKKPNFNYSILF